MSEADSGFWNYVPSSALTEPRVYRPSAWTGHVPFAFWLIDQFRPHRFVELGTWNGMSYLAFCQALAACGTPAEAFAVDTWQGDEHAGPLADEAYTSLRKVHDPSYASFSTLLRMRFDEALHRFTDGSIDLLHIDGLHTYEAVRNDFETWLPKLSTRAIVLFHDTRVMDRGFGVHRFWADLSRTYPSFEFHHAHGLGVLSVGSERTAALEPLFRAGRDAGEADRVRAIFARLGKGLRDAQKLEETESKLTSLRSHFVVRSLRSVQALLRR